MSRQQHNVLLVRTHNAFYDTFNQVHKSKVARLLDATFDSFDMPKMAANFKTNPTPSNIVLGTDEAVIKLSELAKYEAILAKAREKSHLLRALKVKMDRTNKSMWWRFMNTKILYRGMTTSEFFTIAKMGGAVGFHRRTRYAAVNDFVSCSVSARAAALFVTDKRKSGLVVRMDVSQMSQSDYAPVTYEARRNIRVTRRGKHAYNPYEMFGGYHSGMNMRECEIHLRKGSKPIITDVDVPEDHAPRLCRRLEAAVKTLEAAQGQKIMVKYVGVQ